VSEAVLRQPAPAASDPGTAGDVPGPNADTPGALDAERPIETGVAVSPTGTASAQELERWQNRVLPWATRFLAVSALVFAILTVAQLGWLQWHIMGMATSDGRSDVRSAMAAAGGYYLLEYTTIERRYEQSNALLLSRTWIKYLGFLTGMLMVFVGSTYVIGRFVEHEAKIEFGRGDMKGALTASSPGIIVSVLGTIVIVVSIYVNHAVETFDGAIYLARAAPPQAAAVPTAVVEPGDVLGSTLQSALDAAIRGAACADVFALHAIGQLAAAGTPDALSARERDLLFRWRATCEE
jgi:hypothetical protein